MALIDDPRKCILFMFRREVHEGRGAYCQLFEDGSTPPELSLANGEKVFAVYKERYFFTPMALHIVENENVTRIRWNEIASCSTRRGDGNRVSELTMIDGVVQKVRVSDLGEGWSGRISQLYHDMIDRYGATAYIGEPLRELSEFFRLCEEVDDSLFPNLEPHPSFAVLRKHLFEFQAQDEVAALRVVGAEDDPCVAVGLVVQTTLPIQQVESWALSLGADGVAVAAKELRDQFIAKPGVSILQILWD